jgi:hypothetical protein
MAHFTRASDGLKSPRSLVTMADDTVICHDLNAAGKECVQQIAFGRVTQNRPVEGLERLRQSAE